MVKRKKKVKPRKKSKNKTGGAAASSGLGAPKPELLKAMMAKFNSGDLDSAKIQAQEVIKRHPGHSLAWKVLGAVFVTQGNPEDALGPMSQAIKLSPSDPTTYNNLGMTLQKLRKYHEAQNNYVTAIKIDPNFAEAHSNLGDTFKSLRQFSEAERSWQRALQIKPHLAVTMNNWGNLLTDLGRNEEAETKFREAVRNNPAYLKPYQGLGVLLINMGRYSEAEEICREALNRLPDSPSALNNMGLVLMNNARFDEASAHFRKSIAADPNELKAYSNLLFTLNYDPALTPAELYREYELHGAYQSSKTRRRFDHARRPPASLQRLRVGYSSPDFRGHACRFFMEPIFRNHDRDQFELFAYSNTPNPDQHTERMKGYFDHWVDVVGMTDEEMAESIYDDQVDILVDMAGHTEGNRLPVFAMRPAPIQASTCTGYAYTTGLKEVDYFICDENMVPEGSECYFSEEPWRLPAPADAYEPPREQAPDVSKLPALRNGYVTFGSLTRTVRLNDPLLRVWSEILERVPNSRLRLDQKPFADEGMCELFWKRLESLGLPRERVEMTYSPSHWSAYHDIDITLDCWPHNAGTTTLESLWMGVPVLSKMDRPSVGRIGASILKPLGLEDWLVETAEAYVERAVSFASDLDVLSKLRAELRNRVEKGPHLDAVTITGHLEDAYREMIKI